MTGMLHRDDLRDHLSRSDLIDLLDLIAEAHAAFNDASYWRVLYQLREILPIDSIIASVAQITPDGFISGTKRLINVDFPDAWLKTYRERSLAQIDPAARMIFQQSRPVIWEELRETHQDADSVRFYELAADHGLINGFSFGARYSSGEYGSFFSCSTLGTGGLRRTQLIIEALMPHLHSSLGRLHFSSNTSCAELTERERQALNFAKVGLTDIEIGQRLKLTPRTVKFHILNSMGKLGANNRAHATQIAMAKGLIDWA